jgi:hypothetical protein
MTGIRALLFWAAPGVPVSKKGNVGYDGQYSYMLAINPLGSVNGLDQPAYRYQRILYPMVVKLFSLGRAGWVPWVMVAVNLAATIWGCAALGILIARRGRSPWLALVFILSIGYLLAIRVDLNEPTFAHWPEWLAGFEEGSLALSVRLVCAVRVDRGRAGFPVALAVCEFQAACAERLSSADKFRSYALWYVYLFFAFGATEKPVRRAI